MQLHGFHHLTAVTAQPRQNLQFYTGTLGLRRVKKTVNQDDVSAYHLFYGDGAASPGSDITFFHWPAARERRGGRSIVRTGFRIGHGATLGWWQQRLCDVGVAGISLTERDGRPTLDFEDPEGLRLSLIVDEKSKAAPLWEKSSVPAEHQLRGLASIHLSVSDFAGNAEILTKVMNMKSVREYELEDQHVHVFQMAEGGPHAELHVRVETDALVTRHGAGGVHHVAFRTPDSEQYQRWIDRLEEKKIPNSGPVDRFYFRSLYFREPNGILFEIATDGPGFDADEPLAQLGERLSLPPFLENRRAEIEAGLPSLD